MRLAAVFLGLALSTLGSAQGLPMPILAKADPQMVYPQSAGWLDAYGRVVITLTGANLAPPDGDLGHPAGPEGGYQHIYVRGVSPSGDRATAWVPAVWDNGARVLGACASTVILLAVDPGRFLSEPGSHLQVKLWVSAGADGASDPSGSHQLSSPWSAIKTIDVAPAGAVKPVTTPPPSAPAALTRIVPSDIQIGAPQPSFRLKIYGTHLSPNALKVVFNGDRGGAVSAEDRVHYYDDDGSFTKGGEGLIHVTIPERYRPAKPGQLRIAVMDDSGATPEKVVTFSLPVRTSARPAIPALSQAAAVTAARTAFPGVQAGTANPGATIPGIIGPGPQITRLNPTELKVGDRAAAFRIRIYARHLGQEVPKVVFNGEEATAIPAEDAGRTADDDGASLQAGEKVLHVTIPDRYRRATPGLLSVSLLVGKAKSAPAQILFKGPEPVQAVRPLAPAARPAPAPAPPPLVAPTIRR
ncbi:hypothetical protein [Geothrix mesophila]|uniref:hypothetical protein n=1 Tax=Geothrix mesophila TaxID=2922723 RepID=UPI001FAB7B27|nr:hypothetical protein [Geothrix sp. SG198]